MKKLHSAALVKQQWRSATPETIPGAGSEPLEVNVIYTERRATAAALKAAATLAHGLGACICLRAAIAVPLRLPLDQSPVSVPFMEQLLRDLVCQAGPDGSEHTVHLYVCRDWLGTLLQVLKPNSLVVVGGRKRWWPTRASQVARALQAKGHRVAFVEPTVVR
jgi:hypothetical protein